MAADRAAAALMVELERPLPAALPAGRPTAVFLIGACHHGGARLDRLEVVVDGVHHPVAAWGMPRPDRPHRRSGFWATVPISPRAGDDAVELELAARLAGGRWVGAPLGRIVVASAPSPPPLSAVPQRTGSGLIAVCMATFEPDLRLLRAQIDSLRGQTDDRWVCLVSDDCSGAERFGEIERLIGDDRRFALSRSDTRLGFYRNFERALRMVPAEADLVALCDQDDRWHPDKLQALRAALGRAVLAYSDQRLVAPDGRVLRDTLWRGRRNNSSSLASMLIANTITGAATLFRRELIDLLVPFPDSPGFQFHDHWLGVLALAAGEVAYVDRPLYDYVQHAGAVFGDVSGGSGPGARRRPDPTGWRAAYFYGYLAREVQARTVLLRCGDRLTPSKRRELRRFVASARSPAAFAWLALRPLREVIGYDETLGSEAALAGGIAWMTLLAARARHGPRSPLLLGDARFPPPGAFEQRRLRRWRADV